MQRNVIIVGGGRVGRHAAEQLSEDRNTVTIVELDAEKCDQVSSKVNRVIEGDGTDPEVFERTNPESADVVAALTNDTQVNLSICEMAHELAPDVRTILRISRDGEQDHGYRSFVDNVVYPAAAGADVAVDRIIRE
jgi:trk system potassium uptake protein TrkA